LVGLVLMAMWLPVAGDYFFRFMHAGCQSFFRILPCKNTLEVLTGIDLDGDGTTGSSSQATATRRPPRRLVGGPMHAVAARMQAMNNQLERKSGRDLDGDGIPGVSSEVDARANTRLLLAASRSLRKLECESNGTADILAVAQARSPLQKAKLAVKAALCSELLQSWIFLVAVMLAGAAIVQHLEYEGARQSAVEWWEAYTVMMEEFEAESLRASEDGELDSKLTEQVEKALALLDSMGTCSAPANPATEPKAMEWTFDASLLYMFYIVSTIGYGDINVGTTGGKEFVMVFDIIGLWAFGWASDTVTQVLESAISWLSETAASAYARRRAQLSPKLVVVPTNDDDDEEEEVLEGKIPAAAGPSPLFVVMTTMVVAGVFVLFCTLTFYAIEQQPDGAAWTLFDTFWFVFISSTSIGLGDMSPAWGRTEQTAYMSITMFFALVVISLATGAMVSGFQEHIVKSKDVLEKMTGLDLDGDGKTGDTKAIAPEE
jgi:hypothetical protein